MRCNRSSLCEAERALDSSLRLGPTLWRSWRTSSRWPSCRTVSSSKANFRLGDLRNKQVKDGNLFNQLKALWIWLAFNTIVGIKFHLFWWNPRNTCCFYVFTSEFPNVIVTVDDASPQGNHGGGFTDGAFQRFWQLLWTLELNND